jgi:hypothetical protein
MPAYDVRCVRVRKKNGLERNLTPKQKERAKIATTKEPDTEFGPPLVKSKSFGPLAYVSLLGCSLSVSLFIISIVLGDGMSLLATILLSLLSTLVGVSNKWTLRLSKVTSKDGKLPDGDVVIRYPNGSFLIVICDEEIARELYFAPEEIVYDMQNEILYKMISLLGTLLLMLGVIFLANAKLQLQFCWGGAYVVINAAHWIAAALPARLHWDLSCYVLEEQGISEGHKSHSFMDALGKAIMITQSTRWVQHGHAAPQTPVWDRWLAAAGKVSKRVKEGEGPIDSILWPDKKMKTRGPIWRIPDDWSARGTWKDVNKEPAKPDVTPPVVLGASNPEKGGFEAISNMA